MYPLNINNNKAELLYKKKDADSFPASFSFLGVNIFN